jgi:hypothetical protein
MTIEEMFAECFESGWTASIEVEDCYQEGTRRYTASHRCEIERGDGTLVVGIDMTPRVAMEKAMAKMRVLRDGCKSDG